MKRKPIGIMAAVMFLCLTFGLLAGCKQYDPEEDLFKRGFTVAVTFDAGEGVFSGRTQDSEQLHTVTYYVKPGSKIPPPGYNGGTHTIPSASYTDYNLEGWYRGEKDAETGDVTYGEPYDFAADTAEESFTLYAKWERRRAYRIVYLEEGSEEPVLLNTYYADGFEALGTKDLTVSPPAVEGKTFLKYVTAEGGDFDMEAPYPADGTVDVYVYTRFLDGEYTLVREADDLLAVLSRGGVVSDNFYLLGDLDFTGKTWTMPERYNGIIEGNGYSFENLTFAYRSESNRAEAVGLFRDMGIVSKQAAVHDLHFRNVTVTLDSRYALRTVCNIGFLCGRATNLKLEEVSFESCTISFAEGAYEKFASGGFGLEPKAPVPYVYGNYTVEPQFIGVTGSIGYPSEWDE